jgi:hypothetical protein
MSCKGGVVVITKQAETKGLTLRDVDESVEQEEVVFTGPGSHEFLWQGQDERVGSVRVDN